MSIDTKSLGLNKYAAVAQYPDDAAKNPKGDNWTVTLCEYYAAVEILANLPKKTAFELARLWTADIEDYDQAH